MVADLDRCLRFPGGRKPIILTGSLQNLQIFFAQDTPCSL